MQTNTINLPNNAQLKTYIAGLEVGYQLFKKLSKHFKYSTNYF